MAARFEDAVELVEPLQHRATGGERGDRVFATVRADPEDRHETIAGELINQSAKLAFDDRHHHAEELVQQADRFLASEMRGACGKRTNVDEQDRDLLFDSADAVARENSLSRLPANMRAKRAAQSLLFAEFHDHAIELPDKRTELVRAMNRQLHGEGAFRDRACRGA